MTSEIVLPEGLLNEHPRIAEFLRSMWSEANSSSDSQAILGRLASDPRMLTVYATLLQKDRSTNQYLHAARTTNLDGQPYAIYVLGADERQHGAIEETLYNTFRAAMNRNILRVTKDDEVEPARQALKARIDILNEVAAAMRETAGEHLGKPAERRAAMEMFADARALLRAADWNRKLLLKLRGPNDPLTVKNHRGDPIARGVGSTIASFLNDRFGSPLYGTSATLTSVALGQEVSDRVIRSAF